LAGIGGQQLSESEIRKALKDCLTTVGVLAHTLHPTYTVIRVRRNKVGQHFTTTADLSYRPVDVEGPMQRANTKQTTLFYASCCERRVLHPEMRTFTDEDDGLKVALFETLDELRDNCLHGYGRLDPSSPWPAFRVRTTNEGKDILVSYGVWESLNDVRLASMSPYTVHDEDWPTAHLKPHVLGSYVLADPFERVNEDVFWDYLSREFSNLGRLGSETPTYPVSAIAAEVTCDMGFDGISYPSTRCDGRGVNVAIRPNVVDATLRCIKVGLIRVSAEAGELLITHEKTVELAPGVSSFDLTSV
jgi:hypothetical protein